MAGDTRDAIKEGIQQVGVSYEIKREGISNIAGEYATYDLSIQTVRPFANEFIYSGQLAYDTEVVGGDVLIFSDGTRAMVANKTPEMLEDTVIHYEALLLRCNVTNGEILRPSGETWGADYHKTSIFTSIEDEVDAIVVEAVYGNELITKNEFGTLSKINKEVYLPDTLDLRINDRFQPRSGEYYKVDLIKTSIYTGVNIGVLSEDTR